jgi:hypothetical protein
VARHELDTAPGKEALQTILTGTRVYVSRPSETNVLDLRCDCVYPAGGVDFNLASVEHFNLAAVLSETVEVRLREFCCWL